MRSTSKGEDLLKGGLAYTNPHLLQHVSRHPLPEGYMVCSFEGLLIQCETDTSYGVLSLKIEENTLFSSRGLRSI
jgi:hypothetical protein